MPKEIVLSDEQASYAKDFCRDLVSSELKKNPILHIAEASPGAGKSTTIREALLMLEKMEPEYIDNLINEGKKILIVVFSTKNKKELASNIKKAQLPEALFEISTIHSLFFRELGTLIKEDKDRFGKFELDYTKGFFSKPMISKALETLVKGISSYGPDIEQSLKKKRLFDKTLLSEKNVNILWSLANGYFSSPYGLTQKNEILKTSSFFGKKPVKFEDLILSDKEKNFFNKIIKKEGRGETPEYLFFKAFINRITELSLMQRKEVKYTEVKESMIPIVFEEEGGGTSTTYMNSQSKKVHIEHKNIYKVSHVYYYKTFFKYIMQTPEALNKFFNKYVNMIVDEAQDVDYTFFLFMVSVLKNKIIPTTTIVGDSFQGIYAFKSPDHFDILSYINDNPTMLEKIGIEVKKYSFTQTYRFGEQIATFNNKIFGSKIVGLEGVEDFTSPDEVGMDQIKEKLDILSEQGSTAIICRSNKEASKLFMDLNKQGYTNIKLEASAKKELSEFYKKGLMAIPDEHHRLKIYNLLSKTLGKRKMKEYSYDDIQKNHEVRKYMHTHGMSELVKYDSNEIKNYILSGNRSSKKTTWIGTSHLFKGAEYDFVFVAGDFFQRDLSRNLPVDILENSHDAASIAANIFGDIGTISQNEIQHQTSENSGLLKKILHDPKNKEERNILYVTTTRPKKGLFFIESPLSNAILNNFPIDATLNRMRANEATTVQITEEVKTELQREGNIFAEALKITP